MGSSVSKTAGDVGSTIGNALVAPLKSIFGRSCQNVCESIWDVVCFIEHICIPDLVKLLLVCCLCYVCLIFLYMLYKIGVCQCAVKSLCKMCWAACETYFLTMDYICCFCWRKIRYTKRVYRGRRRQIHRQLGRRDEELGYTSDEHRNVDCDYGPSSARKRKLQSRRRERRKHQHKHVRFKSGQVSVRLRGRSRRRRRRRRSSRIEHLNMSSMGSRRRNNSKKFKRQRLDDL